MSTPWRFYPCFFPEVNTLQQALTGDWQASHDSDQLTKGLMN